MWRVLFYFLIVGALAAFGAWLADHPGDVVIHWFGYEAQTSVGALIGLLLVLLVAGFVVFVLAGNIVSGLRHFKEGRQARKRAKSAGELVKGFSAVAMGDGELARRALKASKVSRELAALTRLLTAQVAELDRDTKGAEAAYRELLKDPATEFLGLRGLYNTAMSAGDRAAALAFATRAFEMKPRAPWVAEQLFRIQTQEGAWELARKTIASARRAGNLSVEDARRREGVLAACEALAADQAGDREKAFASAQKALALAPGLTLMASYVAREQAAREQYWAAAGTIETAWRVLPHPDLVRTYASLKPGEPPAPRARRLIGLAEFSPGHVESRLLVAQQALVLGEVRRARRVLRPAVDNGSARVFMLMSEIALKGGEGEAEAQAFREHAVTAPRDAQWTCKECGHERAEWAPICESCGGFDTARWGSEGAVTTTDLIEAAPVSGALDAPTELDAGAEEARPAAPAAEESADIEIFVPPRPPDDPGTEEEALTGTTYN